MSSGVVVDSGRVPVPERNAGGAITTAGGCWLMAHGRRGDAARSGALGVVAAELTTMIDAKKKGVERGEQAVIETCAAVEATQKEYAELDTCWTSKFFALPPNLVCSRAATR